MNSFLCLQERSSTDYSNTFASTAFTCNDVDGVFALAIHAGFDGESFS